MKLIRRMARRLVRAYHASTEATKAAGRRWYREARATARKIAAAYGYPLHTVCGVIAALSPRLNWKRNVHVAELMLLGSEVRGVFRRNADKARRIMLWRGDPLAVLSGPKVRAFYAALMGDHDAAVVDVWTARAAGLGGDSLTPKQYGRVADALRLAANETGERVAALQAIAWVHVRGRAA